MAGVFVSTFMLINLLFIYECSAVVYRTQMIRRDWLEENNGMTNAQRLHRAAERSNARLQNLAKRGGGANYESSINPADGEFVVILGLGYPTPVMQHVIVDTGSDLTWVQCSPCVSCLNQSDPLFDPAMSSTYESIRCRSYVCSASGVPSCDAHANCKYSYGYGDASYTRGDMAYETLSLRRVASPKMWAFIRPRMAMGCGHQQGGYFSNSAGLVGLGRGPLSLISQLGKSVNNKFSYCLTSIYNPQGTSPLYFGKIAGYSFTGPVRSTPFLTGAQGYSSVPGFYYLDLEGISVQGKAIDYPKSTFKIQENGGGGFIIDSGTTFTYLAEPAYIPMKKAVQSHIKARALNSSDLPLDLCYLPTVPMREVPSISFTFAGGAVYDMPANNTFVNIQSSDNGPMYFCFAFLGSDPSSFSTLGNVAQQNYHIEYDVGESMLSWAPANCDKFE